MYDVSPPPIKLCLSCESLSTYYLGTDPLEDGGSDHPIPSPPIRNITVPAPNHKSLAHEVKPTCRPVTGCQRRARVLPTGGLAIQCARPAASRCGCPPCAGPGPLAPCTRTAGLPPSPRHTACTGPTGTRTHWAPHPLERTRGKGMGWHTHGRLGVNGQQRYHKQTVSPLPSAGGYAAADVPLVNPHRSMGTTRSTLREDGTPPKAATSLDTCRGYMAGRERGKVRMQQLDNHDRAPGVLFPNDGLSPTPPSIHQTHPPKVQEGVT
jgi:hypothetical protein